MRCRISWSQALELVLWMTRRKNPNRSLTLSRFSRISSLVIAKTIIREILRLLRQPAERDDDEFVGRGDVVDIVKEQLALGQQRGFTNLL